MIALLQRVNSASVTIEGSLKSSIKKGLLVFIGITHEDREADVEWLCTKILQMRIFGDAEDKMNLSLQDIKGELLIVSQFTLHAQTKKGNRPSFIEAARPEIAIPLYESFIKHCTLRLDDKVKTGTFGADMKIDLQNDGPVTIIIDSKNKV